MEIVLASSSVHKIREFKEMLKHFKNLDILTLHNFPQYKPPEEGVASFKENAEKKAMDAASQLKKWVLADDSGLVVPSLGGSPGVTSRRYAGEDATDADNRKKLLSMLAGKDEIARMAFYECWLALASPEGLVKSYSGKCEGYISCEEKGRNGFGYDPIFIKHDYDRTFGELDEGVKNRISHRRKAIDKLSIYLETLLKQ